MKNEFELARERRRAREQKDELAEARLRRAERAGEQPTEEVKPEAALGQRAGFRGETDDGIRFE